MKGKDLPRRIKRSCRDCPYRQKIIEAFVSPCPQCRLRGYPFGKMFILLQKGNR